MEILNKITMKKIGAQPAPFSVKEAAVLAHIFGKADGFKTGSTTYGLYDKFHGDFEAVNLATGEMYAGANLLCPPIMEALIKQALVNAGAEGGKVGNKAAHESDVEGKNATSPVLFAFALGVRPTAKKEGAREVGSGYEYTVSVLTPSRRSDALESLRAISDSARKALPAPEKTAEAPAASQDAPATQVAPAAQVAPTAQAAEAPAAESTQARKAGHGRK